MASDFDAVLSALPAAPLPALGTDYAVVTRDGVQLNGILLRDWPLSNPVAQAIATRLAPSDLATINGQSLVQPGGNIVIAGVGAPSWGGIIGTLSDQTDLQDALNAKANTSALGSAAYVNTSAFATAAQGALADTALQPDAIGVTVQAFDEDTAKLNAAQAWTARQRFTQTTCPFTTLTYAATLLPNLAAGQAHVTTLTGNATLGQPSGEDSTNFQSWQLEVVQDATGGRTLAFNTSFYAVAGGTFPTLTTTGNARDVLTFNRLSTGKYLVSIQKAVS